MLKKITCLLLVDALLIGGLVIGSKALLGEEESGWVECKDFNCPDMGAACKEDGAPIHDCDLILCLYGGYIICRDKN